MVKTIKINYKSQKDEEAIAYFTIENKSSIKKAEQSVIEKSKLMRKKFGNNNKKIAIKFKSGQFEDENKSKELEKTLFDNDSLFHLINDTNLETIEVDTFDDEDEEEDEMFKILTQEENEEEEYKPTINSYDDEEYCENEIESPINA